MAESAKVIRPANAIDLAEVREVATENYGIPIIDRSLDVPEATILSENVLTAWE
jgi:hypothetical protein